MKGAPRTSFDENGSSECNDESGILSEVLQSREGVDANVEIRELEIPFEREIKKEKLGHHSQQHNLSSREEEWEKKNSWLFRVRMRADPHHPRASLTKGKGNKWLWERETVDEEDAWEQEVEEVSGCVWSDGDLQVEGADSGGEESCRSLGAARLVLWPAPENWSSSPGLKVSARKWPSGSQTGVGFSHDRLTFIWSTTWANMGP